MSQGIVDTQHPLRKQKKAQINKETQQQQKNTKDLMDKRS